MTQDDIKVLTDAVASNQSQITQLTLLNTALQKAIALANAGYQSDQDAIAQQVSDGISAALSPVSDAVSAALAKVAPSVATSSESIPA